MKGKKQKFSLLNLIVIIIITSITSSITTGLIIFSNKNKDITTDVVTDKNLQEFVKVYDQVSKEYFEDIDKDKLIDAAIDGMMKILGDDYTTYLDENDTESLEGQLTGRYEGIGVQIANNNIIFEVFKNSPAWEAGIQKDDIILKVNDQDVSNLSGTEIAQLIKSSEGKILLHIKRNEEELDFEIEKKELDIPSVEKDLKENNGKKTGYIRLSTFSNTSYSQFKDSIEELEKENIDNLIIDLRDNTGGYLVAATEIANMFVEKDKILFTLQSNDKKEIYRDETKEKRDYKIVILLNENSASASEILAAALKDNCNAIFVGKKSYGKGKVQQTYSLTSGAMVKYTSAKWLRPNGECIDKVGLVPDYEVDMDVNEEGYVISDTQLNKAIEILGE